jgi:hypothetical protein
MLLIALHVFAVAVLGMLVRRRLACVPVHRRLLAAAAGTAAALVFLEATQARVYVATDGADAMADRLAAAVPAGDFAMIVLTVMALALLPVPRARVRPALHSGAPS